jgi:hypothetical protein
MSFVLPLARAGRTRYQQLAKLHSGRKWDALDVLKLISGDRVQFWFFNHVAVEAERPDVAVKWSGVFTKISAISTSRQGKRQVSP